MILCGLSKTSYRGNEGLVPAADFISEDIYEKKKIKKNKSYMLLWEPLFIYMMEQSAKRKASFFLLLLHFDIRRNAMIKLISY